MHYTHASWARWSGQRRLEVPTRAEYVRVITSELNPDFEPSRLVGRIAARSRRVTPILYAFEDREKILDLLEALRRPLTYLLLSLRRPVQ